MAKKEVKEKATERDFGVLLRPLVTEKASLVGHSSSAVVFEVDRRATKDEVKGAVSRIFNVEVLKVRTINVIGKLKRRGREVGRTKAFKKAYVTLAPGQAIDVIEGL
ncbi:MAG: 50S ribosomal protein L23 [Bdellovibrionales bacterium]|nr:50S ribosomal protein L23 [Bdellovibrionales bacterium]